MRDKLAYEWGIPIATVWISIEMLLVSCVGWFIILFTVPRCVARHKSEGIINE